MAIHRQKIGFNSHKVTVGDPKDYSNRASDRNVNSQAKPQKV